MNLAFRIGMPVVAAIVLTVFYSPVHGEIVVPTLKGERVSVARQIARIADFELATGVFYISPENWRDDLQGDVIYLQSPAPETRVADQSVMACWVFRQAKADQKIVPMPDLTKSTVKEALSKIQELELELVKRSDSKQPNAEHDAALVVEQYPRAGQKVYVGTSVYLTTDRKPGK